MKVLTLLFLFAATNAVLVFLARLSADVPARVRISVAAIAASFCLTFLLVWRLPLHTDWGLNSLSISITVTALLGFQYLGSGELSREERMSLLRRYAAGLIITSIAAVLATGLIYQLNKQQLSAPAPRVPIQPDTAKRVTVDASTQKAIDDFKKLAQ
ncbi:hypothetical protein BN8_03674 [Fibrisoma limi BUZ 3]|uniref:Uncharacterized protein n=1 Tax=Fibrisoma limi BUZ 3 TaxID=1185876 RepID=I2GKS2_9BACT|nr:hypothetical protein [Fibrisoma limi]CCH54498.1 hypothetical protein BN8_03674 [Fibrisoma limi BUZ 3]